MARIGFRFMWCTGPHFLLALMLSIFGNNALLSPWLSLWMLAIPFIGGVIDWLRLNSRSKRATGTTA